MPSLRTARCWWTRVVLEDGRRWLYIGSRMMRVLKIDNVLDRASHTAADPLDPFLLRMKVSRKAQNRR